MLLYEMDTVDDYGSGVLWEYGRASDCICCGPCERERECEGDN